MPTTGPTSGRMFAWCFSHGTLHRFDPENPWCTATTEEDALAAKQEAYGDAQFLHHLPAVQQLEVIEAAETRPSPPVKES